MANMTIYFSPTAPAPFEPFIDPQNYCFTGEEILVPPRSLVICIPCQNLDPAHLHNIQECKLMTFSRGWDYVQPSDYVTVYVVDHEHTDSILHLETGELLSTFLTYNSELHYVSVDKCVMEVNSYWPIDWNDVDWADIEEDEIDDGYESDKMSV